MNWIVKLQESIVRFTDRFVILKKVLILWDILYVGVIGLNSYILLIYTNSNEHKMMYVMCAMAFAYTVVLTTVFVKLRKNKRMRKVLYSVKKIFRVIYTLTYLTIIILHLIRLGLFESISNIQNIDVIYNIVMFLIITLLGALSLWWKKILKFILKPINK
ncbi:uncharacterized membrane protein (DUF485 family) [Clostridium beijerinckii]|nr:uncharacterized membrane protein (DUF485 family) [Clostridium beijerinckii]OOM47539.1 hypothetical protein CBEIJ_27230 [Clostridium beijerinckii]